MIWPGVLAAILLGFWGLRLLVWRRARQRIRAGLAAFKRENPPGPPLTPDEQAALRAQVAPLAYPVLGLISAPDAAIEAGGTRLGGPVWIAEGNAWPQGRRGQPLEFIGQLDFSALPALPDFPESGILQFFASDSPPYDGEVEAPGPGEFALRWHETLSGGGQLVPPPEPYCATDSPWTDAAARGRGMALRGVERSQTPGLGDENVRAIFAGLLGREGVFAFVNAMVDSAREPYAIGDRTSGKLRGVADGHRVLLRLDSGGPIIWDHGAGAVFEIPTEALRRRDWSEAGHVYSYDQD